MASIDAFSGFTFAAFSKKNPGGCSCYNQPIFNRLFNVFFRSKRHNILKHITSFWWFNGWLLFFLARSLIDKISCYMQKKLKYLWPEQQHTHKRIHKRHRILWKKRWWHQQNLLLVLLVSSPPFLASFKILSFNLLIYLALSLRTASCFLVSFVTFGSVLSRFIHSKKQQ